MPIGLKTPQLKELKPRIVVCGVGGAGGNAINNMIASGLSGVDFVVANTDAQALGSSRAQRIIQMGLQLTEGLGAGSRPEIGKAAAEETLEEIRDCLVGSNMVFIAAGMGGGTGTGAAPLIAAAARSVVVALVAALLLALFLVSAPGRRGSDRSLGAPVPAATPFHDTFTAGPPNPLRSPAPRTVASGTRPTRWIGPDRGLARSPPSGWSGGGRADRTARTGRG